MINTVVLTGRLTKDIELRRTTSGKVCTSFTLAVNRNKQETDFINCVAFGNTAELVAERVEKGGRVLVQGSIKTGSYENKEGKKVYTTDVIANRVQIIDWAGEAKINFEDMTPASNEDIPF